MVVFGSPKGWDRWHSPSPNWQEKYHLYTTYMLPSGGLYATYHLLREPASQPLIWVYNTKITQVGPVPHEKPIEIFPHHKDDEIPGKFQTPFIDTLVTGDSGVFPEN